MKKLIIFIFFIFTFSISAQTLKEMAGSMLMVGFFGTKADKNSQICKDIKEYNLGGVILFDRNPVNPKTAKNIKSKSQLKKLVKELKECSPNGKLLVAVDQEGGLVQRLKSRYGFYGKFPSAKYIAQRDLNYAKRVYFHMARELRDTGVNYDLAPVVDLALNPKNRVIVKFGRSFGKNPEKVVKYASVFIEQMHKEGILTALKHFPGHGSSTKDTHKGFVDVTSQWKSIELIPYKELIDKNLADTVMVAHIFNRNIDAKYPASLSKKTVDGLLRKRLGFRGVIITDDLQMGAISKRYSLSDTLRLAINAGDDLLLFGNQLDPRKIYSPTLLVNKILSLVKRGKVSIERLRNSSNRIKQLKSRLKF